MFGLATTLFYAAYVIFGIPSNIMLSIVGARRWIATIMVLWDVYKRQVPAIPDFIKIDDILLTYWYLIFYYL